MEQRQVFPALVAGVVVVAALVTLVVPGGWLVWVPVGAALAVVGRVKQALDR
jgi:hypothetical protein